MTKRAIFLIAFSLTSISSVFAQEQNNTNQINQGQDKKTIDKKFWIINGLFIGSTIYDVESKFYVLDRCEGCREGNVFIRPIVEAGKPWTYVFFAVTDAAMIHWSYSLKKENKKLWFIIPITLTAAHTVIGTHNIRLGMRY